jgi:hypothetical protein
MKFQSLIIMCLIFATFSLRAEKKTIYVKFTVGEVAYRNYLGSKLVPCEKIGTSNLVKYLNETFGFFHFEAGNESPLLKIELTAKEKSQNTNDFQRETGFKSYLMQGGDLKTATPVYWIFRSVDKWIEELPELKEDFINEVTRELVKGLNGIENRNQFVANVLSKVEVANNFYFIPQEKWIILPLTGKENNIAKQSLFLVVTSIHKLGFEDIDFQYKTQVINAIKNIDELEEYHLPNIYRNGSLALQKLPDDLTGTPFDSAHVNTRNKSVFILKHVPLVNKDDEPANLNSTPNPN